MADYLHTTPDRLRNELTWGDYKALCEHWRTEPPVQVMVARYLGVPKREAQREMSLAEVVADFAAMGLVMG